MTISVRGSLQEEDDWSIAQRIIARRRQSGIAPLPASGPSAPGEESDWDIAQRIIARRAAPIATPPPPEPAPADDGFFSSAWDGFVESLSSTPETSGEFLEALGRTAGSDFLQRKGRELQAPDVGAAAPAPRKDLFDAETFGEFRSSLGRMFGEGMGSTLPSMVLGAGGAAAGAALGAPGGPPGIAAGAVTGGRLGAAPASYVMNTGDLYRALKEEGADADTAAGWAMAAGVPIAALDVYSLGVVTKPARQALFRNIAKEAIKDGGVTKAVTTGLRGIIERTLLETGKGMAAEAGPEALQQTIQEATVAGVTGKPLLTAERAKSVALAGIGGALVGGPTAGGGQAMAEVRGRGVPEPAPIPVTDETGTADPGALPSEAELSELRQAMVAKGVPEARAEELLTPAKADRALFNRLRQNVAATMPTEPTLTPEDEEAIKESAANLTSAPELTPFLENAVELGVPASQAASLDQATLRTLMALRREVDAGNQNYRQRADALGQQLGLRFDVASRQFVAGGEEAAPTTTTEEPPATRKQREELREAAVAGQQEVDTGLRATRREREELAQRLKEAGLTTWGFTETYFPERGDFAGLTSEEVDAAHGVLDAITTPPPAGMEPQAIPTGPQPKSLRELREELEDTRASLPTDKSPRAKRMRRRIASLEAEIKSRKAKGEKEEPAAEASAVAGQGRQSEAQAVGEELQRVRGRQQQRQTPEQPQWQEELPMRKPLPQRFAEDDFSDAALMQPVAKMSDRQLRTALEKIPAPKPTDKGKAGWRLQRRADALSEELKKRIVAGAVVEEPAPPSRSPVPPAPTGEPAEVAAEAAVTAPTAGAERRFVYRSNKPLKVNGLGWRLGTADVEVIDDHTVSVGQVLDPRTEQSWGLTLQETVNVPRPAAPEPAPAAEARPVEPPAPATATPEPEEPTVEPAPASAEPAAAEPAPAPEPVAPAPLARSFRNDPALKRYVLEAGPAAELDRMVVAELRDAGYKWNKQRSAWLAMPTPAAQVLGERLAGKPMTAAAPASAPTPDRMSLLQIASGALAPSEIRRIAGRVGESDDPRVKRRDYFRKLMSTSGVTMEDFIGEALADPDHSAVLRGHGITDDSPAMVDKLAGLLSDPDALRRQMPISDKARQAEISAAENAAADDEQRWLRETLVETKDLKGRLAAITDADALDLFTNEYVDALGRAGAIGWGPKKIEAQTQAVLDAVRQRGAELAAAPAPAPAPVVEPPAAVAEPEPAPAGPTPTAAVSTPTAKEPWEQTKAEFRRSENEPRLRAIQEAIKAGKRLVVATQTRATQLMKPDQIRLGRDGTLLIPHGKKWVYLTGDQAMSLAAQAGIPAPPLSERVYHHVQVRDALAAGKPVPASVLADYPDLQRPELQPESAAIVEEPAVEAEPPASDKAAALIESYRDGSRNLGAEKVADLDADLLPAFIAEARREREMLTEGRDALADRDDLPELLAETLRQNATAELARVDRQIAEAEGRLAGGAEAEPAVAEEPALEPEPEAEVAGEPAPGPAFALEPQSAAEPARKPELQDQPLGLELPKRVLPGTAKKAEGRGLEGAALSAAGEAEAAAEAERAQEALSFEPQAGETPEEAEARRQAEQDIAGAEGGLPGVREVPAAYNITDDQELQAHIQDLQNRLESAMEARRQLEAEGKTEESNRLGDEISTIRFAIRDAEREGTVKTRQSWGELVKWAAERWPVQAGIVREAEKRGNQVVFRLVRNPEEAMEILRALDAGTPNAGFRIATVVDGHAIGTKGPKFAAAVKKGQTPIFTSPYPTVSYQYDDGAGLLLAIEHTPDGLIYSSSRAGQTQSAAYSAVFPDAEHIIDAKSVQQVYVLSPAQWDVVGDHYAAFEKGYSRGAYKNAFRDKDPALAAANLERARNLEPRQEKMGRPFLEEPLELPNGLKVKLGDKIRTTTGATAVLGKSGFGSQGFQEVKPEHAKYSRIPGKYSFVVGGVKGELPTAFDGQDQGSAKLNLRDGGIVAVWDKGNKRWIEAAGTEPQLGLGLPGVAEAGAGPDAVSRMVAILRREGYEVPEITEAEGGTNGERTIGPPTGTPGSEGGAGAAGGEGSPLGARAAGAEGTTAAGRAGIRGGTVARGPAAAGATATGDRADTGAAGGGADGGPAAGDEAATAPTGTDIGGGAGAEDQRNISPLDPANAAVLRDHLQSSRGRGLRVRGEGGDLSGRGDGVGKEADREGAGGVLPRNQSARETFGADAAAERQGSGYISLWDKVVTSFHDFAVVAQVFRNPHVEHSRLAYVGMNTGKILAHEGFTSDMADQVANPLTANRKNRTEEQQAAVNRQRMASRVNRLSKSAGEPVGVILLHNHPSGNSTPSDADRVFLQDFRDRLPTLNILGQVVINSSEYSVVMPDGSTGTYDLETGNRIDTGRTAEQMAEGGRVAGRKAADPLFAGVRERTGGRYGMSVNNARQVVGLGADLKVPDNHFVLMYRGIKGDLQGHESVPVGELKNPRQLAGFLKKRLAAFGAKDAVLYYDGNQMDAQGVFAAADPLVNAGLLADALYLPADKAPYQSARRQGAAYGERVAGGVTRTAEEGKPYDPDTFDPNDPEQVAQLLGEVFGEADAQWYRQRHQAAIDAASRGEEPPPEPEPTPQQQRKMQDAGRAVVEVLNPRPKEPQWKSPALQKMADRIDRSRRDSNVPGKLMAAWGEEGSFAETLRLEKFVAPSSRLARWWNKQFWRDSEANRLLVKAQAEFLKAQGMAEIPPSLNPLYRQKRYEQAEGIADNAIETWAYAVKEGWFTRAEKPTKRDILNAELTPADKQAVDMYLMYRQIIARENSLVARHTRRVAELKEAFFAKHAADLKKRGLDKMDIAVEMERFRDSDLAQKEFAKEKYQPIDIRALNPGDGPGKGMIAAEARAELKEMERELGADRYKRLQRVEHNVAKVYRVLLRDAVDAGTISRETYNKIIADQKQHGDYLGPFTVVEHLVSGLDKGGHFSAGFNVEYQDQVLRREGTNKEVMPLTDATPRKMYAMVGLNERNRVMRDWYNTRNLHDEFKDLIRDLPVKEVTEEGTQVFSTPEEMGWKGFTQLSFLENGKPKHFAIPDPFAAVLLALDKQQQNILMKSMSFLGNTLRYGATGGNPTFAITQIPQDFLSQRLAADDPLKIFSPKDWKLMWNAFQTGLFQVALGSQSGPGGVAQRRRYRKLRDAGAAYTGFHQQDRPTIKAGEVLMGVGKARKEGVAAADAEQSPWLRNYEKLAVNTKFAAEVGLRTMGALSTATEYMTRMGVFEKNVQSQQYRRLKAAWDELPMDARSTKGRDVAEVQTDLAAYKRNHPDAKVPSLAPTKDEIAAGMMNSITSTIDFREGGAAMRVLTQLSPFTMSRVGAARTFVEGAQKNPTRAMALGLAYMALEFSTVLAGWLMFGDLMRDLDPQERKDRYILPVGVNTDDQGADHPIHLRIRKDTLGQLATTPVRTFVDYLFTRDLAAGAALADLVSAMTPVDIAYEGDALKTAQRAGILLAPPVMRALFEVGAGPRGYDYYRQRELMTEEQATRKPYERYNAYSSFGSLQLGRALDVAPLKVDHLMQGLFGSLGADLLRLPNYTLGTAGVIEPPMGTRKKNLAETVSQLPIARGFFSVRGGNRQRLEHLALDEVQIEVGSWAFGNRKRAKEVFDKLQEGTMTDAERAGIIREFDADPDKLAALKLMMKKEAQGRNSVESRLGTFGQENGSRALAIAYLFNNSLLTDAERINFIAKHSRGKPPLVTPLVFRQLLVLMQRGTITPAQAAYDLYQKEEAK